MDVELNFINESSADQPVSVVIFKKNVTESFDELAVAWKVIKNCGVGWREGFTIPMNYEVNALDEYDNVLGAATASDGDCFVVQHTSSGKILKLDTSGAKHNQIRLRNELREGAITANIYKNGKLLGIKKCLSPQQEAVFEFDPTIWIGVVEGVEEGETMNSAIVSNVDTQLSLLGVKSADIVMTGGGPGKTAEAFKFQMENVKMF